MAEDKPPRTSTLMILKCLKTQKKCHFLQCVCCGRATNQRFIMSVLVIFGIILCYTHRVCLSLAITEMTSSMNHSGRVYITEELTRCGGDATNRPVINPIEGGKYDWDEATQSYLLMAFYIGYLLCNIPAGYLCDVYGAKWVIVIGCSLSSICTALIPLLTMNTHWAFVVLLRILTGAGQAPIYPGATRLMSNWIPDAERALVGGVVLSSLSIGTILGNIPTAYILEWWRSWVWVFYTYAISGGVFVFVFMAFVYSSPDKHPYITPEEAAYLRQQIVQHESNRLPLRDILSDVVVWSCIIVQFGNDYTLFTIITNFPKYLNDVLKFNSKQSGLLVCIPQVALFISSFVFGGITDALVAHTSCKTVSVRIINTVIASIGPCICLLVCCKLRCDQFGAIVAITAGMALKAAFYGGMKVTIIDITKSHTGIVAAIVNAAGGLAGAVAPYTIGQIAQENSFEQWDLISYVTILIGVVTVIPYTLFAKAERRDWDYSEGETKPSAPLGCKRVFSCVNPT